MSISERITDKLKADGIRFHASDNISEYLGDSAREQLVDELAEKFDAVLRTLIIDVETDPNSEGTAKRLAKMYVHEIMRGRYHPQPKCTAFPNDSEDKRYEGMLVVRSELTSMCSHHHQTVRGIAYIGIIPGKKVIGLSKYTRLAQHCAMRGTLQEELCRDILETIKVASETDNVAVYIHATHGCCENRGVRAHSSLTQTCLLSGEFHNGDVKKEFFDHIKLQQTATGGQ
jgi:GTP cyclohydrolase I